MKIYRDYGAIDIIHTLKDNHNVCSGKKIEDMNGREENWVCFLPWRTRYEDAKGAGLNFEGRSYVVYEMPVECINPRPEKSRESILGMICDFEHNYSDIGRWNVLGFSLGTLPATILANIRKVDKLILVCPGARLGESMWSSFAARKIRREAKKLGMTDWREYDRVLGDINPIDNTKYLPKNVSVHLGDWDWHIRPRFGDELVRGMESSGKNVSVVRCNGKGHLMTIREFGSEFDRNINN